MGSVMGPNDVLESMSSQSTGFLCSDLKLVLNKIIYVFDVICMPHMMFDSCSEVRLCVH